MNGYGLTHGWGALKVAYLLTWISFLAALIRRRRQPVGWLLSPLLAVPVAIVAWLAWGVIQFSLTQSGDPMPEGLTYVLALIFFMLFGYGFGLFICRDSPPSQLKRGADMHGQSSPAARESHLSLAGVPVPLEDETKHFKFIGTTGTGKSTAIAELLQVALARGDRAVIADPDGGYLRRFYDPTRGDVILNPFDARSVVWDLFGEIDQPYDVEHLAQALISGSGSHSDREWKEYGRTFFAAVARQLYDAHDPEFTNVAELCRMLIMAPTDELRSVLGNTAAAPFLEDSNAKMLSSIRSVASSAIKPLEYVQNQRGKPFSVRQWVKAGHAGGAGGILFLPYTANQIAALSRLISAWMRIAIFETMNEAEGGHRLWFIVDELDALGTIDGLKDALARLRKFGGRCVLGFQSIAQVRASYGHEEAATIVENCGNTLILRCSASEGGGTARFASQLIGEREIIRRQVTKTRQPGQWTSSETTSDHHITEPAVMPSEFEQLPDLEGFLKLASSASWKRIKLERTSA